MLNETKDSFHQMIKGLDSSTRIAHGRILLELAKPGFLRHYNSHTRLFAGVSSRGEKFSVRICCKLRKTCISIAPGLDKRRRKQILKNIKDKLEAARKFRIWSVGSQRLVVANGLDL